LKEAKEAEEDDQERDADGQTKAINTHFAREDGDKM
jgi:hypothetical protein